MSIFDLPGQFVEGVTRIVVGGVAAVGGAVSGNTGLRDAGVGALPVVGAAATNSGVKPTPQTGTKVGDVPSAVHEAFPNITAQQWASYSVDKQHQLLAQAANVKNGNAQAGTTGAWTDTVTGALGSVGNWKQFAANAGTVGVGTILIVTAIVLLAVLTAKKTPAVIVQSASAVTK